MSKGSDAGASPISPDAEKAALEWLESIGAHNAWGPVMVQYATTLKAILAEPRLPAEPSWHALKAMTDGYAQSGNSVAWSDAYRALYAHMTAPKTKTVEVWHVEHCVGGTPHVTARRSLQAAEATAENAAVCGDTCIHVTGPHKQEVPA